MVRVKIVTPCYGTGTLSIFLRFFAKVLVKGAA